MSKAEEKVTKLGISAAAMVTSAYVGSLIGDSGTLIGTGVGAVVGGAATEVYQVILDRGKHHFKSIQRRNRRIAMAGVAIMATGVVGYGSLTLVEAATNKPLHAITTGAHESGTSIGGSSSSSPAEVVTPPTDRSSSPSFSPSPSLTLSPSSPSSSTPEQTLATTSASATPPVIPSTSATPIPSVAPTTPIPSPTGS